MNCGRCRSDTRVRRHEVDGFVGYLCADCRAQWTAANEAGG